MFESTTSIVNAFKKTPTFVQSCSLLAQSTRNASTQLPSNVPSAVLHPGRPGPAQLEVELQSLSDQRQRHVVVQSRSNAILEDSVEHNGSFSMTKRQPRKRHTSAYSNSRSSSKQSQQFNENGFGTGKSFYASILKMFENHFFANKCYFTSFRYIA